MKILWIRGETLHPVRSGGQIVSFEIARRLHQRHEIHFVAYESRHSTGALSRAHEYCAKIYRVEQPRPYRAVRPYALEVARALISPLPFDARILDSPGMRHAISERLGSGEFDALFCDGLSMAADLPNLEKWVILDHNVESIMVGRRSAVEPRFLVRRYHEIDARRTAALEKKVCRRAAHVIAISELDSITMRKLYGAQRVTPLHIGVSAEDFARPAEAAANQQRWDLVFVGHMGWVPKVDGVRWFTREVLTLIHRRRPETTLAVVGQRPLPEIVDLGKRDPRIVVTGTVEDVRPWLWGGTVSIVPIRHGGGVRIKIFEAMAAGIPVVSTTIGAEGLEVAPGEHLLIADDAAGFAEACLLLLENEQERARIVERAGSEVREKHSWDRTAKEVEAVLEAVRHNMSHGA